MNCRTNPTAMATESKSVLETLQSGTAWLEKKDVPEARRNMEYLLAHVLGVKRLDLYLQFDRPLDEKELAPLRVLLKRRGTREPLQHLLGTVDFAGEFFNVDNRALIPRPETEELVMRLLRDGMPGAGRILDVGCGSGVLGLSLAKAWGAQGVCVDLVDTSPLALALATENAQKLDLLPSSWRMLESDLFSAVSGCRYDLVVANLPYIPTGELPSLEAEVQFDPMLALDGGDDGLSLLRRFAAQVSDFLHPHGKVALEVGAGQGPAVAALLAEAGLHEAHWSADYAGVDRFVFAHLLGQSHSPASTEN